MSDDGPHNEHPPPWQHDDEEEEKPGGIFSFLRASHLPVLIAGILISAVAGLLQPAMAIYFGRFFNAFSDFASNVIDESTFTRNTSRSIYALLAIGLCTLLLKGGVFVCWVGFGELQAKSARLVVFQALLNRDIEWFDGQIVGMAALLERTHSQIQEMHLANSQPLGLSILALVQALSSLGLALGTNWKLTLVVLSTLPVILVGVSLISRRGQKYIDRQNTSLDQAMKAANHFISNIVMVKCFNAEVHERRKYVMAIEEAARNSHTLCIFKGLQSGFVRFATTIIFVQGLWYGGTQVHAGTISPGEVVTTFWSCLLAAKAFEDILPQSFLLLEGRRSAQSLAAILHYIKNGKLQQEKSAGCSPRFCDGAIAMRGVSFAYPSRPTELVLQDCDICFPAGQITFLVGKSGCGKSTVGNLLMRFYLARSGTVTIDGVDISDLNRTWLRNNLTLVQQQSVLFNETIFTNIALGSQDPSRVTLSQVEICSSVASLDGMISNLPHGLATMIGSRGSTLSGGQRQRVAIARARLRDTPVLILDEATSALDTHNRNAVMESIRHWRRGRTTIIVTHDLTQIRQGDLVYVMDAGRVIHRGSLSTLGDLQHKLHLDGSSQHTQPYLYRSKARRSTASISIRGLDSIRRTSQKQPSSNLGIRRVVRQSDHSRGSFSTVLTLRTDPAFQKLKRQSLSRARAMYSAEIVRVTVDKVTGLPNVVAGDCITNLSDYSAANPPCNDTLAVGTSAIELPNTTSEDNSVIGSKTIDGEKPARDSTLKILQRVWPFLNATTRVKLILGFMAALIHAGSPPAFAYAIIQLFGTFSMYSGYHTKVLIYSLAIIGVAVFDGLACASMQYLLGTVSQTWVDTLRRAAVKRILQQPKGWFDKEANNPSILVSSLDRNAEGVRVLVDHFAPQVLVVMVMMTVGLSWSLVTCWKMALVSLAGMPVIYAVVKLLDVISFRWSARMNSAVERLLDVFIETFSDIKTVRALTLESFFHEKYSRTLEAAFDIGVRRAIYTGACYGLSEAVITLFTPMLFWYGVHLAKSREWPAMDILTAFSLLLFSTASASAVMAYVPRVSSATEHATRLIELARMAVHSHENAGMLKLDKTKSDKLGVAVSFTNQTFFYPTRLETPALRRLNLTIPSGKCTAVVGSSGSGKSTITSLILGLYPPAANESVTVETALAPDVREPVALTLFGFDIRTLEMATLRSLIAVVPQTPFLLPATVRENIIYGLEPGSSLASARCIESAAGSAGIHEFIQSLPQGYATIIGEGRQGLSGGQAQRIVIARALVRDPKILILDEATSALDRESADTIRTSIIRLIRERQGTMTAIVITHAMEMMTFADQVVVLENGSAVEEGPYYDLIRRKGKLWDLLAVGQQLQGA